MATFGLRHPALVAKARELFPGTEVSVSGTTVRFAAPSSKEAKARRNAVFASFPRVPAMDPEGEIIGSRYLLPTTPTL